MEVEPTIAVTLSLASFLVIIHLFSPKLRSIPGVPEPLVTSFSGGFAVSFVFLHMLPGLVEHKESLGEFFAETYHAGPLTDLGVFLIALLGFVVSYGIAHWSKQQPDQKELNFNVGIGSYAFKNAIITYTMPLRIEADFASAVVFVLAMGLHFLIIDRHLEEHFPKLLEKHGRAILAGAIFVGWATASFASFEGILAVVILSSFLAGSVLFNVFHNELSDAVESNFKSFLAGISSGTVLLLLIFFMEHQH